MPTIQETGLETSISTEPQELPNGKYRLYVVGDIVPQIRVEYSINGEPNTWVDLGPWSLVEGLNFYHDFETIHGFIRLVAGSESGDMDFYYTINKINLA